jgi:hypothetical protein
MTELKFFELRKRIKLRLLTNHPSVTGKPDRLVGKSFAVLSLVLNMSFRVVRGRFGDVGILEFFVFPGYFRYARLSTMPVHL